MCQKALAMNANAPAPFLLDAAEAAELVRLSVRSIRRRVRDGSLPAVRTAPGPGGKLLIRRSDLLKAFGLADDPVPAPEPAPRRGRRTAAQVLAEAAGGAS